MTTTSEGGWQSSDAGLRTALHSVSCGADLLIVVSGELDLVRHDDLRAALAAAAQSNVTMDFADVAFVDVSTITLLALAAERRLASGWRTGIVNCQPQVRRVFWLTQAQHLLAP